MPTTADDIWAASQLRSFFGRLRPGFYDHEARHFEGPRLPRRPDADKGGTYQRHQHKQEELFGLSRDGSRIVNLALPYEDR